MSSAASSSASVHDGVSNAVGVPSLCSSNVWQASVSLPSPDNLLLSSTHFT